jgi:hypothetical protein
VAGDRQELVDAVDGEVADAAPEVRPHDAGDTYRPVSAAAVCRRG